MSLKRSFGDSRSRLETTVKLALRYYAAIGSTRALTLHILVRNGEWDQVAEMQCVPLHYNDVTEFHKAALATGFLAKYEGLPTSFNRKDVALEKFRAAEKHCQMVNSSLIRTWDSQQGAMARILRIMVENISSLVGEVTEREIDEIFNLARWGNGVTSSCKGVFLSLVDKMASRPDITPQLGSDLGNAALAEFPHWQELHPNGCTIVGGNRVQFVPKNAKTDRSIAVEPTVNARVQRGVGRWLKQRLRRWKVNLANQSWNCELARQGSVDQSFATIDLSAASDTVSREVVERLLPDSWSSLLNRLRSWRYSMDGKEWHWYEKHSSMGNGYTFELESLIFASAVRAVYRVIYGNPTHEPYAVYGDDIIVTTKAYPLLVEVLTYLGFTTNKEKTFSEGPFRESCGADWFNGVGVRPFFFKRAGDVLQLIEFANWLRAGSPQWLEIATVWRECLKHTPVPWRLLVPKGISGGFWVNIHETRAVFRFSPLDGYTYRVKAASFRPHSVDIPDSVGALGAVILQQSHNTTWRKLGDPEPARYSRRKTAREVGRWERRAAKSVDWPVVRIV